MDCAAGLYESCITAMGGSSEISQVRSAVVAASSESCRATIDISIGRAGDANIGVGKLPNKIDNGPAQATRCVGARAARRQPAQRVVHGCK